MIPKKLKKGDEIRIIAPARSLSLISKEIRNVAKKKLEELGFKVTYAKNAEEDDGLFISSSIKSRIKDMHQAFADKKVKAILTIIGGFNSNQLLNYLDYNLIKSNPKILCGFSDITALANAIYTKTGLITYSGPHFSTFAMKKGIDYTIEYFKKCLVENKPFEVKPSKEWCDDEWWLDQLNRKFRKNKEFLIINEGKAEGTALGGNLCTLQLLHGTEYMPQIKEDIVLFIEDCVESKNEFAVNFDRDLQSIIHQPYFKKIKGILIGRFENEESSGMNLKKLKYIIKTKKELDTIPIIANLDFGHTEPKITFPIGGRVKISAHKKKASIKILKH